MNKHVESEIKALLGLVRQSNLPEKPKRSRRQGTSLSALTARSEADVMRECTKYLKVCGYLTFRMNVGAVETDGRFVRFGTPGMADLLTFKHRGDPFNWRVIPVWLEMKSSKGKQSPKQRMFQEIVESESHRYFVIRSVAELIAALAEI